ncbi:UNVERIFIED_CONTAM: hypothetical protein NCL1_47176 [Trichonephila clavipes]
MIGKLIETFRLDSASVLIGYWRSRKCSCPLERQGAEGWGDRQTLSDGYLIRSVKMSGRRGAACFLLLFMPLLVSAYRVKIGVVSGPGSDRRQNSEKFWSFGRNQSTPVALEPVVYELPYWSTLEVVKAGFLDEIGLALR